LAAILGIGFAELQPFVLYGIVKATDTSAGLSLTKMAIWLKHVAILLALTGIIAGFLGRLLGDALKRVSEKQSSRARAARVATKLAMYIAGAAVPAALWLVYLHLSFWGIRDCGDFANCMSHTPSWLVSINQYFPGGLPMFYFMTGVILFIVGWLLEPNANSLHRLYRDRLSKAFLFDPTRRMDLRAGQTDQKSDEASQKSDLLPLDDLKLSGLAAGCAPYHLINAALNIRASKYVNRRGRNADFFIFSPLYVGSKATGYVVTETMEEKEPGLTAGTAMAISGAAASSNMGSATIKPLVPALAMLNIRLGYWLLNPAKVAGAVETSICRQLCHELYFFNEFLGRLDENSEKIYLTDGGHIENLGIYELLRRRCKLIIAVDAEADPEMSFGSLITLERYARIDFGIRIELPWQKVRDAARRASGQIMQSGVTPSDKNSHGPHCALGTIYYPRQDGNQHEDSKGLLLYIKSSITGDERDYILDYKRRNRAFPHETTWDQLFREEQFEVYRSLGFHAAQRALDGSRQIAMDKVSLAQTLFKILAINGDSPALA
jgi:hypothetical protein